MTPFNRDIDLNLIPNHGRFGAIRKYDIHTGLDIYCYENEEFNCIFDGVVVNIFDFTGEKAGSPWWNDTKGILVKSNDFCILYGEVEANCVVGDLVKSGDILGRVKTVLKKDKGLPMNMLHVEAYEPDYIGEGEIWNLNSKRPKYLLNIEQVLFNYI